MIMINNRGESWGAAVAATAAARRQFLVEFRPCFGPPSFNSHTWCLDSIVRPAWVELTRMVGRRVMGGGKGSSQWGVPASGGFPSRPRALPWTSWLSKCSGRCGRWKVNFEKIKSEKSNHMAVIVTSRGLPIWPPRCPAAAVDNSVGRKWSWKCEDAC